MSSCSPAVVGRSDPKAVYLSMSPRLSEAAPRDCVAYIRSRPKSDIRNDGYRAGQFAEDSESGRLCFAALLCQMRCETQSDVVRGPIAVGITELRSHPIANAAEVIFALLGTQYRGEAARKGLKPAHHVRQYRWPRDQRDVADVEAGGSQSRSRFLKV